jgi:hypothetical protein
LKALSLTQPFASLIALRQKHIETRSWYTPHRDRMAIHASKGFPGTAKRFCESRMVCRALGWPECPSPVTQEWLDDSARLIKSLPLGMVLCTCRVIDCVRTQTLTSYGKEGFEWFSEAASPPSEQELAFGNYDAGRYAWILGEIEPLPEPVPAKGSLGLWEWKR